MSLAQLTIRHAVVSERRLLEALQWRASLNNPGDRASLIANPDAVELPRGQIEGGGVFVAEVTSALKGWAAILPRDDGDMELDALFVEPEVWGRGIGAALVERCGMEARAKGALSLHVVGNPHAEGFYRKCGFQFLSERQMRFGNGLVMKKAIL
jgi:GNAT superfamily N-acetyltransferase